MKKKILAVLLLVLMMLSGCAVEKKLDRYSQVSLNPGFDTVVTLIGYTAKEEDFDRYFNEMEQAYKRYNELFDIYNDYPGVNNLKTINDKAGIEAVSVDPEIIEMLELSKQWYELSQEEFDVTQGSLFQVWHRYREDLDAEGLGKIPSQEELKKADQQSGWNHVQIDKDKNTVYIDDANVSLDVGGIAKGFATEKTAQLLEKSGLEHGILNGGGNIRTIGTKPEKGASWGVGIQNPDASSPVTSLGTIQKNEAFSMVTSGDYQRYYIGEDGKMYHHIIDPSTLFPANHFHSVTVVLKDSGVADALSTTMFTLDYQQGLELIEEYNKAHPEDSFGAVWVSDKPLDTKNTYTIGNLTVTYTDNLKDILKKPN